MLGYGIALLIFELTIFIQAKSLRFNNLCNMLNIPLVFIYCIWIMIAMNPVIDHLLPIINVLSWFQAVKGLQ
jgi:hypothetical protein